MRTWFAMFLLLVGISSACAVYAQAPSTSLDSAIGSERLLFAPPNTLHKAYHDGRVGSLTEYVPEGETVENWTEMVTVQVFRGLAVGIEHGGTLVSEDGVLIAYDGSERSIEST